MAVNLSRLGNVQSRVSSFASNISRSASSLNSAVGSINSSSFSAFTGDISSIASKIDSSITGPLGEINNFTAGISSNIDLVVKNFSNQLLTSNQQIVDSFGQVKNIFGGIANPSQIVGGLTQNISQDIGQSISGLPGKFGDFGGQALRTINSINGVTSAVSSTIGQIGNISQSALNTNLPIFEKPLGNLASGVGNIQNSLTDRITGITSRVNGVVSNIDTVSKLLSNPEQLTSQLNRTLDSLVQSGINRYLAPINNIFGSVNDFAGKLDINFGSINELIGGSFSGLTQPVSDYNSVFQAASNNRLGNDIPVEYSVKGADGSDKLANVLRNFNTYNYIITVGVIGVPEINNPTLYRNQGEFDVTLVKSGGGNYNTKQTVAGEAGGAEGYLEYFIDNVEIDSVFSPNSNTGLTLGTNISFTVTEPYSMGKFLESIVAATRRKNYENYRTAFFCMKIEFVGWNDNGEEVRDSIAVPRYVPFIITNMEFEQTSQGGVYSVTGVVSSDMATEDKTNRTNTPVEAIGKRASDILLKGRDSVTEILNSTAQNAEEEDLIKSLFDRHLIIFPNQPINVLTAAQTLSTGNVYEDLKSWFEIDGNINLLGKSDIIDTPTEGSNVQNSEPSTVWDPESQIMKRNSEGARVPADSRLVSFHAGTTITSMIEEVIKNTTVIKEAHEKDNGDGRKLYFRIETHVFLDDSDPSAQQELGRHPRVYVYAVHPYYYNESITAAVSEGSGDVTKFKKDAAKEYNYFYTGRNEDILNFNINFNHAYHNVISGDFGNRKANLANSTAGNLENTRVETPELPGKRQNENANSEGKPSLVTSPFYNSDYGGMRTDLSTAQKRSITDFVHNKLINSEVDMITVDLEIWGDPYYIPTDFGNYTAAERSRLINSEYGMPFIRDEIYCNINFRSPLDYKVEGFVIDFPELVRPFYGTYQVITALSKFNGGKFTQELKLLRHRQDDPAIVQGQLTTGRSSQTAGDPTATNPNITAKGALAAASLVPGVNSGALSRTDVARELFTTGSFSNENASLRRVGNSVIATVQEEAFDPRTSVFGRTSSVTTTRVQTGVTASGAPKTVLLTSTGNSQRPPINPNGPS